ncbi:MAG: EI24 domain-containing protein [Burkholderiales bacterium]
MHPVIAALNAALRDLREPRVLALALVPPLVAIAVWAALVWAFADDWARWVAEWIATTAWLAWLRDWGLASIFIWASGIAAFALLVPVMFVTAVVATELLAMPVIVPLVAGRHFPQLERRRGGTAAGSAWNAATSIILFAALWLLSLPLWLTGIGALALPALISALFNQRVFRYDALAEHASAAEYRAVVQAAGGRLYALGLVLAALYYVPIANLLAPILSGLAFTHLCLHELARFRR